MSSGELLSVQPTELKFRYELHKQSNCSLHLINTSDHYVAFKVKTTSPKKYCVRPNAGIILPKTSCDIMVTMQAQREMPPDLQCKDKFLLQSVVAPYGTESKDVTQEMFNKEPGKVVEECKLRVSYEPPPKPPSPVPEGSEEGLSPNASSVENGKQNVNFFDSAPKEANELKAKLTEAQTMLNKLTEEKNSMLQQTEQLRSSLDTLRRRSDGSHARFSIYFCFIVCLLGIIVGHLLR